MANETSISDIENIINNLIYGEFHKFHNTWAAPGQKLDQMFAEYPLLDRNNIAGTIDKYKDYELAILKIEYINPAIRDDLNLLKFYKAIRDLGYADVQEFIDYLSEVLKGQLLINAVAACTEAKQALGVLVPLVGPVIVTQLEVIVNGVNDINSRINRIPITGKI